MAQQHSLTARAVATVALFVMGLAMVVWLAAGTARYWQSWVFLSCFGGGVVLITLDLARHDRPLLERRLRAGPVAEPTRVQQLIQSVAGIAFVALLVTPGLDRRIAWSTVPLWVVVLGDVAICAGLFIVFLTFRANSYAAGTVHVEPEQLLVTTGPYAVVRHPMYSGALMVILGTPVALGSVWGLLWCVPLVAVIVLRLRDEERHLDASLPGFQAYRATTRYRLVPGIY